MEADEAFTTESFNGSLKLTRPARKHGGQRHRHVPLVPALFAMNRYEHEADAVLLDESHQQIAPELQPLLSLCSILCTDGSKATSRKLNRRLELSISD